MENNLFWVVIGFIFSQVIMGVYVFTNLRDREAEHEKLKRELIQRLFIQISPHAQYDLRSVIGELFNYLHLEIEQSSGLTIKSTKPIETIKEKKMKK